MKEEVGEIISILNEIKKWIIFLGWQKASELIYENIKSEKEILIYHLTDGKHSIRDIISEMEEYGYKTSYGAINNLWKKWAKIGIVESIPYGPGYRQKRLFDLEKFGYELPKKTKRNNKMENHEN